MERHATTDDDHDFDDEDIEDPEAVQYPNFEYLEIQKVDSFNIISSKHRKSNSQITYNLHVRKPSEEDTSSSMATIKVI